MARQLIVRLNGTTQNPWTSMGLTQNPFPQIAKYELMSAMNQLNSLNANPLQGPEDIRARLSGWSEEFIELCIKQYKSGKFTQFIVEIPEQ